MAETARRRNCCRRDLGQVEVRAVGSTLPPRASPSSSTRTAPGRNGWRPRWPVLELAWARRTRHADRPHADFRRCRGRARSRSGCPAADAAPSVLGLVDQLALGDPGHHAAQALADLLDPCSAWRRRIALKLTWPALFSSTQSRAKRPSWMSARTRFISALVSSVMIRAGLVVAVLGGVADRVAHVGEAALVDQVDDQLHLVQALEIGHLGRVAGLDQRLVAGLDQRREPPQRTTCSPNRSVSHSSLKVVSITPARPPPMALA